MNQLSEIKETVSREKKLKKASDVMDLSIYDMVLQRIYNLSRRRIAWLRMIWTEASTKNKDRTFNYHSEVDAYLSNRDTPNAETLWLKSEQDFQSLNKEIEKTEDVLMKDNRSRLSRLIAIFKLTAAEVDVLQCCLALTLDPNLERVYAYLQDHKSRSYVTKQLVSRLFNHGLTLTIPSSSPLYKFGLIKEADTGSGEPARLYCDPFVLDWLLGSDDIDKELSGISKWQRIHPPLTHWPVDNTLNLVRSLMARNEDNSIRVFVAGQEGSGRRTFAAVVCSRLGLKLLCIQTDGLPVQHWRMIYMYAQRQAMISGCAVLWQGRTALDNDWPGKVSSSSIPQFIIGEVEESVPPSEEIVDCRVEIPVMPAENTYELWKRFIPITATWPKEEIKQMFRRQQPCIGQLVMASKKEISSVKEASEVLRSATRQRLGDLASQLTSYFNWDDLIIPTSLRNNLNDFYFEATERASVWEEAAPKRLFPQGRGLVALFTGVPGTGKTMAAQVIANSLELDLFRIDLSSIVSKYIGETSKNVERILSRAKRMDIVLLFDEADALFGKRTDVKDSHDRYANTDTNYLLQAIEEYPGIVILASNRKSNIDSGFIRRLRYVLEFPKPDAAHRLELWRRLLSEITGTSNASLLDKDLQKLAPALELTGAQIKSSVLSAIFMARREEKQINVIHLLRGVERELSKENRGLGRQGQDLLKQTKV